MSRAVTNLQIDSARLWGSIHETAQLGATQRGGVRRLTLSAEDKQVRDWFRKACEDAGLEVHIDALGSMFGLRRGRDMSKPPVGIGSHLDTQPTGGKFDGVLGVLGALEAMRTLHQAGYETNAPVEIVNWTNDNIVRSFGWSIILVTVVINLALFPLRISSMKSMRKMQALKPQIDAINAKYKGMSVRDPFVGMAMVLDLMASTGKSLSELSAELPAYSILKDKYTVPRERLPGLFAALEARWSQAQADRQDGLRLDWADRWVHVRPSNTEPIVRVIAEAPREEDARALCREVGALLA